MMPPCKDCPDRYTACHDHCEKYQKWKEDRAAEKKFNEENGYFIHRPKSPARKRSTDQYLKDRRRGRK